MKTAPLYVLLLLACSVASAAQPSSAVVPDRAVARPTVALATLAQDTTLTSTASLPERPAAARPPIGDEPTDGPGWRERLALLGAALLALVFILRRQVAQRSLGHSTGPVRHRATMSRAQPPAWSDTAAPHSGFTLSAFDNLPPMTPASDRPTNGEPVPLFTPPARRLRAAMARRSPGPPPRRKVRLRVHTP